MSSSTDALSLLTAAVSASDPAAEEENLRLLYKVFQTEPHNLPLLFPTLMSVIDRASDTLRQWIVDVIDLTFCKPTLGSQTKATCECSHTIKQGIADQLTQSSPSFLSYTVAVHMPGPLLALLNDASLRYARVAITAFASIYQPLFKVVCLDRSQGKAWQALDAIKKRIVELFDLSGHMNIKLAALKAFQKIILVQTRAGETRVGSTSRYTNDANVGQVPPDHPFLRVAALEAEANERLTQVVTLIFTSANADLVMAAMNSLSTLAKFRQSLSPIVFEALISWTPSALISVSHTLVRSVEKTLRLLYLHFHPSRNTWAGPYAQQIVTAIETQRIRMEAAAKEEEEKREKEATSKRERLGEEIDGAAMPQPPQKRKRVRFASSEEPEEEQAATSASAGPSTSIQSAPQSAAASLEKDRQSANAFRQSSSSTGEDNPLASFDVTTLPLDLVIELILANLQALTDQDLQDAITRTRSNLGEDGVAPTAQQRPPPPLHPGPPPSMPPRPAAAAIKQESKEEEAMDMDEEHPAAAQNPLNVDVGDEEVLDEAERNLGQGEAAGDQAISSSLAAFVLPPPGKIPIEECKALMQASVGRICANGAKLEKVKPEAITNDAAEDSVIHSQLWSMLVTRLATRGFCEQEQDGTTDNSSALTWKRQSDAIRQMMLEFVVADFGTRIEFAVQWMAEEFYCEVQLRKRSEVGFVSAYSEWLHRLVEGLGATLDGKDRSMMNFLNRLPHIPDSIIDTLEVLCLDKAKMRIGFGMLRELVIQRVPLRDKICSILLRLTRHEEKAIRSAAIITVRNWVRGGAGSGSVSEAGIRLEETVLESARDGLRRLTVRNTAPQEEASQEISGPVKVEIDDDDDEDSKSGLGQVEATPSSALDDPNKEVTETSDVIRLVELPFALCVRVSSMLDEIFEAYTKMSPGVQQAVKKIIVPLIQTLGPNNAKLLSLIRRHPSGSEALAVAVFTVMTDKQKSKKVVDLIKEMAEEKSDIDPRFLIPILPDLVKSEIIKYLPRVVTILSSEKPEDRATIKAVFTSIVTMPDSGFGSVSTNLPRVRSSELLTPVELMTLLHHSEREIGLKTTAEAIRICFGMTDIFRSEVLGAVLNLILEEPNLPVLFMRTAIMAVRTYKLLSSYISTVFLSRLISKKVWQQPLLWDGFVLCAKQTAPASFGALIQLPREQLRDVITKQPDLRAGLREYLIKKAGGHRGRLQSFLELLGEDESAIASDGTVAPAGTPADMQQQQQQQPSAVAGS